MLAFAELDIYRQEPTAKFGNLFSILGEVLSHYTQHLTNIQLSRMELCSVNAIE